MANLGVQLPDLSSLMGGMGGYAMGQQKDMAYRNNQINQDAALQNMLFESQKQPLDLESMSLGNQTRKAQLPGIEADSWAKTRNNDVRKGISLDTEQRAAMSKIAAQMSDDDWKQSENALQQALISGDKETQAQAQKMLPMLKEFQMEALKNKDRMERDAALQAQKAKDAKDLMAQQIDAGRFKGKGASGAVTFMDSFSKLKNARDKHAALVIEAKKAELDGDMELAQRYAALAAEIRPQAEAEIQNSSAKPGSVNVADPRYNVPVVPDKSIAPGGKPAAQAAPKPPIVGEIRRGYKYIGGKPSDPASWEKQ